MSGSSPTWKMQGTLKVHDHNVRCIAFSPDGKQMATASFDSDSQDLGRPRELHRIGFGVPLGRIGTSNHAGAAFRSFRTGQGRNARRSWAAALTGRRARHGRLGVGVSLF